jgi:hypothetical protein
LSDIPDQSTDFLTWRKIVEPRLSTLEAKVLKNEDLLYGSGSNVGMAENMRSVRRDVSQIHDALEKINGGIRKVVLTMLSAIGAGIGAFVWSAVIDKGHL